MLTFKEVGRMMRDYDAPTAPSEKAKIKTKREVMRFQVDAKDFPGITKKADGDECLVVMKVVRAGSGLPREHEADKDPYLELEIKEMAEIPKKGKDSSEDFLKDLGYKH